MAKASLAYPSKAIKFIIKEKEKLLKDFGVEWTDDTENKILNEIAAHPEKDAQAIADAICRKFVINAVQSNSWSQL